MRSSVFLAGVVLCGALTAGVPSPTLSPISGYTAFPWAASTPADIRHDHLDADAFVDEDTRPWRAEMARRFAPVVAGCKTRREAILMVNRRCAGVCGVKYSTARRKPNQGVRESLDAGTASCTGLSILLAAAYRSVGIPARLVQVAEWGDRPGNHTWVEVWDDDGWHCCEYYPDAAGLDHGWLLEPCARLNPAKPASRVVARAPAGDEVYRLPWDLSRTDLRGENRTAAYVAWAHAAGHSAGRAETRCELVIIGAESAEARVARAFALVDAAGKTIARGTTPGPLDDANNAPRFPLKSGASVTVEITGEDGVISRRAITLASGVNTMK